MIIVRIDKKYFRPNDVINLRGDASKARKRLGWKIKTNIHQLINEMMKEEYQKYSKS
jgi:GDPmannose 4,6-dehydratase